ncbi:YkgJ family cysteine cluster protein [Candidatus Woesearchaeota archaeon]|nr:YkgJ family cysteine cluster protein [Candidatus Woesearchaeota archaeon]
MRIKKETPKEIVLKIANECYNCGHCCRHTSGFILKKELKGISKHLGTTEEELEKTHLEKTQVYNKDVWRPKRKGTPYGECIFHDEGCKIQDVKPLFCAVSNCNSHGDDLSHWFMLNYVVDESDPESVRQWAQVLISCDTIEGGNLEELVPDKQLLKKILSYEVLR